jgi:Mrp family chromosome partitioning ATPase/capsular polysaccharide biosynthesis protein
MSFASADSHRHLLRPTSAQNDRSRAQAPATGEDPIEVARYVESLRRSRWLMAAIVAIVTGAVIVISLAIPKNYEATANIVINGASGVGVGASGETVQRELATIASQATTMPVLAQAAKAVRGESVSNLEAHVTASVDQNANIIHIGVGAKSGKKAAALAYAVAQAFLEQHTSAQRAATTSALTTLDKEIEVLRSSGSTSPTVAAQLAALQTRAGVLESARASSSQQLQLEQPPTVPSSASSPRPFRNAVIALFASLFLAVLVALGREQLTPRVSNQRELGQLLDLPVLAGIPYAGRRINARSARAEQETYQTLSAALQLALPPGPTPHVILITSAGQGEGKTTVAARLARLLSHAGQRTLVVSGDLRVPRLDEVFHVSTRRGLSQLLTEASSASSAHRPGTETEDQVPGDEVQRLIVPVDGESGESARGTLDVLPAGSPDADAASLLQAGTVESIIATLRESPYAYILVDSPPILGIADTQLLARFCDELLVVGRLNQLTISKVIDLREALFRVRANPVGLVVIGTRPAESPYYAGTPYALAPS